MISHLNKTIFIRALLFIAIGNSIVASHTVKAAISAGSITQGEEALLLQKLSEIKNYTARNCKITDTLFSKVQKIEEDLKDFNELESQITAISVPRMGSSPFAKDLFGFVNSIASHLKNSASKWIKALKTKSLLGLRKVENEMKIHHSRLLAQISNDNGGGLKPYLSKSGHTGLLTLVEAIEKDINYVFLFNKGKSTLSMGNHLRKKGFGL